MITTAPMEPASLVPDDRADDDDVPIAYLQRTRSYYAALGYGAPYCWAHFAAVPFQRLPRPLAACRVALVTTAAPYQPDMGDQGPGAPYNAAAKFYAVYSGEAASDPDLRIAHVAIDRRHTSAEDQASWFPLGALRRAAAAGRIDSVAARFHGAPTNRSQRTTLDVDAPEIVARCLADGADAAVLVANCPVCHQTLALIARQLEAAGIATVVLGCAKDIVEHVGVPRLLFSDFPLGNAAGRPHDLDSQALTLELALALLEGAPAARTTLQSPLRWSASADWKLDYCNIERLSAAEIARRRAEFDAGKAVAQALRDRPSPAGLDREPVR
jgi:D-proline reductase (dithiol) PrdB